MNPRILKKLSKRADELIQKLDCTSAERVFYGDEFDPCLRSSKMDKRYVEHWQGKPNDQGYFRVLLNTIGYGEVSGYYEPEWEDSPAYDLLRGFVIDANTDWDNFDCDSGDYPELLITLKTPSQIFRAAEELLTPNAN